MEPMTTAKFLRDVAEAIRIEETLGTVRRIVVSITTDGGGTARIAASWPAPKPAKKGATDGR